MKNHSSGLTSLTPRHRPNPAAPSVGHRPVTRSTINSIGSANRGSGAEEFGRAGAQVDDRRRARKLQQRALLVADRQPHLLLQRFEAEVSENRVVGVDGSVVIGDLAVEGRDDGSTGLGDVLQRGPYPQCPGRGRDLAMLDTRSVEVAEEQVHVEVKGTTGVSADPAAWLQRDLHEDRVGHRQFPVRALVLGEIPGVARERRTRR